jgi:hypothetical protein
MDLRQNSEVRSQNSLPSPDLKVDKLGQQVAFFLNDEKCLHLHFG